jgi:DNA invertase Pin-like site-specific DNA recombinase
MTDYGFIRVSTGSQDATTQEANIRTVSPRAIIVHADTQSASASKGEQLDALDAMVSNLGDGDRVIVTDSSRLDRRENLDDQVRTMFAIKDTGAVIVSLDPGESAYATSDFAGWQATITKMYVNAEKSRTVKEQTWRTVRLIMDNKASYGPLPVFWETTGERYHKQAVCTNPDAVRAAYRAARDGRSIASIARDHGVWPQSIRNLLRDRANMTGVFECRYTYGGQTYTWDHQTAGDPVVDKELWHAANRVMDQLQKDGRRNLGGRPVKLAKSWISGLLDCPRCGGHLYVVRGTSLRCAGRGKDRRSCGVSGINLARVTDQIETIVKRDDVPVYRYQRVSGNQGELDELQRELERLNQMPLTTIARSDRGAHVDRIAGVEDQIEAFDLVADTFDMTPTGETLAEIWETGDKREIFKAIQRYLNFHFMDAPKVRDMVWQRNTTDYPGGVLIELSDNVCVRFPETPA